VEDWRVAIELPGGDMGAFLAAPDVWPPRVAVVVVQEWWGLNGQIEGMARRLAASGIAAIAPDLYRGRQTEEPDEAGPFDPHDGRPVIVPFQAHHGSEGHFSPEMIDAIREQVGLVPGSELHWYEGAPHAFMNEEGDSYRADAAELAWRRLVAFFRERLRAS
jgi:dienelactone hydrolase